MVGLTTSGCHTIKSYRNYVTDLGCSTYYIYRIKNNKSPCSIFFSFEFIRSLGTLLGITLKEMLIVNFSLNINRY